MACSKIKLTQFGEVLKVAARVRCAAATKALELFTATLEAILLVRELMPLPVTKLNPINISSPPRRAFPVNWVETKLVTPSVKIAAA
jgi:hypothetical protein